MSTNNFDSIMRQYDKLQIESHWTLEKRTIEVYEAVPEYQETEDLLKSLFVEKTKKKILGDTNGIEDLQSQIEALKEKKKTLLISNGFSADYLDEIYECKDCKDTGYLPDRSKCHCLLQKIGEIQHQQSGLERLFETENFDHLSLDYYQGEDLIHFEKIYAQVRKFIEEFSNTYRNLFFYGKVGTGKSFLSCCIAKELLDKGYTILYYSAADLFDQIAEYRFSTKEKNILNQFTNQLYSCDLLIIDDLGTECTNTFVSSELFSILNKRHADGRSTIISSNIEPPFLRDHYSERVFSRVASAFEMLEFTGPDIRVQKKLQAKNN